MHLTTEEYALDGAPARLRDVDRTDEGAWVAVAGEEWSPGHEERPRVAPPIWLLSAQGACRLPFTAWTSLVRIIDQQRVLIVHARAGKEANAWITTTNGEVLTAFNVGDGVEDVLIAKDEILITYFDEGIFSGNPPADEGVAAFDMQGNYRWGYRSHFGTAAVDIWDCYCATISDTGRLYVIPYTEERVLIGIDPEERSQVVWPLPNTLRLSRALSIDEDTVYLYGPLSSRSMVFAWKLGSETITTIGAIEGHRVRGLPGGRFLFVRDSGYTLVSAMR